MTRIFLVRHGETDGNKKKIYRGHWDLPLNQNGKAQVEKAGEALQAVVLSAIYVSPLLRARQTAEAVASRQNVQLVDEEALIDIDYGDWTEMPDAEIAQKFPDLYRQWKQSPESVLFPDGEGLYDVRKRAQPMVTVLAERHPDQSIALVSHRVPIKVILCAALGLDDSAFWRIQVDTASISALDCNNGVFTLIFSNETCHLKSFGEKLGVVDF
jgi:broad specificity phosphatase PhoE